MPSFIPNIANTTFNIDEDVTAINGGPTPPVWIVNISKFRRGKIIRIENYLTPMRDKNRLGPRQSLGR